MHDFLWMCIKIMLSVPANVQLGYLLVTKYYLDTLHFNYFLISSFVLSDNYCGT